MGLTFYIRLVLLTLTLELGAGLSPDIAASPINCIAYNNKKDVGQREFRNLDNAKNDFQPFELIEKDEQNRRSDDNDNVKYHTGPALHLLHQLYFGVYDYEYALKAIQSATPCYLKRYLFVFFHCWKFHL